MTQTEKRPTRYRFILNPYPEERSASCPKCDGLTEQRKFPLMIHVHPLQIEKVQRKGVRNRKGVLRPMCQISVPDTLSSFRRLLLPGRSLRGAERPACKPRGASGIVALVEFAPCGARRHGVPHPLGVAFASPHRLAATCQPAANGSRSGGVAVLRQSRSALRRSQQGHSHGRAIGAGMDDSASWKTEETIIRLTTVQIWWLSPFNFRRRSAFPRPGCQVKCVARRSCERSHTPPARRSGKRFHPRS